MPTNGVIKGMNNVNGALSRVLIKMAKNLYGIIFPKLNIDNNETNYISSVIFVTTAFYSALSE